VYYYRKAPSVGVAHEGRIVEEVDEDSGSIRFHSVELGRGIKGFMYQSKRGVSHVFVDESLSPEMTLETIAHELYHVKHDSLSYGIGLDRQQDEDEKKANRYAKGSLRPWNIPVKRSIVIGVLAYITTYFGVVVRS